MLGTFRSQNGDLSRSRLKPNVYKVAFKINCKFHPDPTMTRALAHPFVQKRSLGTCVHKPARCEQRVVILPLVLERPALD